MSSGCSYMGPGLLCMLGACMMARGETAVWKKRPETRPLERSITIYWTPTKRPLLVPLRHDLNQHHAKSTGYNTKSIHPQNPLKPPRTHTTTPSPLPAPNQPVQTG